MRRFSSILAALVLCGLTSIACKQDVGQRCEQPSDCASGYCGGSATITMMTSAAGRTCTAGQNTGAPLVDAAIPPTDTAASDAATGDAVAEAGGDAPSADVAAEAGADVISGADASGADGPADASADGSAPEGGADAGLEVSPG